MENGSDYWWAEIKRKPLRKTKFGDSRVFRLTIFVYSSGGVYTILTQMQAFECQPEKHIDLFGPITQSGSLAL